jgi:hypothetical protein
MVRFKVLSIFHPTVVALSIPNNTRHWAVVLDQGLTTKPDGQASARPDCASIDCSAEDRRMVHGPWEPLM